MDHYKRLVSDKQGMRMGSAALGTYLGIILAYVHMFLFFGFFRVCG